ncbi:putative ABC transport system permease protein [Streptomyces sp. TLI_235]|nr:FtsX-like permease family protein [Streptomyces sp. TLI_235]PBC77270.1 putative ABC transport system permease protein [Streptomyces sp. TLI_235]
MFVAWRDLRFAKGRFALMGAVVVLITVLVGLLSGLTAGLARGNISAVTGLNADHLAFAAPADGRRPSFADSALPEPTWQEWARTPGVTAAEPLGITTAKAAAGSRSTAVSAFGSRPAAGLAPQPVQDGTAVLSTTAAEELGAHVGDTVTLARRALTVAAVAGDAAYNHTPVVWTTLDDWQRIAPGAADGGPHATVVALRTGPGADLAAADTGLGTRTLSRADSLAAIGAYTSENGSLQLMRGFLFAISALVIGAFFTVWTIQRTGDIAVLKALGASTRRLTADALGQAAVLLVLGTALGSGIAAAAGALVAGTVPFVLDPPTLLLPALVMIGLGSAGAALAVRRITSVDPLTALGSTR